MNINRYELDVSLDNLPLMLRKPKGRYVLYTDYAQLETMIEELSRQVELNNKRIDRLDDDKYRRMGVPYNERPTI